MKTSDFLLISLVLATVFFLVVLMPLAQIWAINTLFGTKIAYNLTNWFAVVILSCFWLRVPSVSRKKD